MVRLISEKNGPDFSDSVLFAGFFADDLDWNRLFLNLLEQIQSSVPFELYKPQQQAASTKHAAKSSVPFELYKPQLVFPDVRLSC